MTPIDQIINNVVNPVPKPKNLNPGDLYPTHEGIMDLGGFKLRVYVLNNGQRIINADDLKEFFGADALECFQDIDFKD